ncbi:hypothetical protein [Nocardioides bruguierae]|uniref:Uncharacterized protein n=1 Tax=Nocardioides bruguierae TaxID=2945102 RepID=A0A9X2D5B3_9ACTN|nr:hypothetical protein [Nocardioides bruguierae]MCM0619458.1 hypothetical protein [Nocardioides bruguierae]
MTSLLARRPVRTAFLVVALASLLGALLATQGREGAAASQTSSLDRRSTTTLTIATGCGSCRLALASDTDRSDTTWSTRYRAVEDGEVQFSVPTWRTVGLTIMVRAPWVDQTSFQTVTAVRYAHEAVGSRVDASQARQKKRASGCWAGTGQDTARLRVVVRKQEVETPDGTATAALAWTRRTQAWLDPRYGTTHGVLGTQSVMECEAPVAT